MTFTESVKICLRKFVDFKGRASRREFWWFQLFTILVTIPLGILDGIIFGFDETDLQLLSSIANLILFVPILSSTVRRYHDTNRSGWWVLGLLGILLAGWLFIASFALLIVESPVVVNMLPLALIFFILGVGIVHLVWLVKAGTSGHNRFGPDPLADDITVFD